MSKNKLQEYCQKNNIQLPVYVSNSTGPKHILKWTSMVTIKNTLSASGEECDSKKAAEESAAENLLNIIANMRKNNKPLNNQRKFNKISTPV